MRNIDLIFEANPKVNNKVTINNSKLIYRSNDKIFSGKTLTEITKFVNGINKKYKNLHIPIIFSFGNIELVDKLSYVIFECICYSLMVNYKHLVYVFWKPDYDIWTSGVFASPLKLLNEGTRKSALKYPEKFKKDTYKNHYRRVISSENKEDTNYLGDLYQQLDWFLKTYDIDEDCRDQVTEVISELVGNACEHASADCLLDIDITTDHCKTITDVQQDGTYYGINIAIVNFSSVLIGDGIKRKLSKDDLTSDRYIILNKAYKYHRGKFGTSYTENDFFNVAALQDKISGRPQQSKSGGTGLTKLIRSLQEKADNDACYFISGDRCLGFYRELLEYDNENWLPLNKERDFLSAIPDEKIFADYMFYMPGTAYNLNFIMKRKEDNNE